MAFSQFCENCFCSVHYNVQYCMCSHNAHYTMKIYKYRKLGLVKAFAVILDINVI